MTEPLPLTNRCGKCGEWFHNAHVCANSIKISKDAALSASPAPAEPVQPESIGTLAHRAVAEQMKAKLVRQDTKTWCAYIASVIDTYLSGGGVASATRKEAIAGIIERRLYTLATPQSGQDTKAPTDGAVAQDTRFDLRLPALYDAVVEALFAMGREGANASLSHPLRKAWEKCRDAEELVANSGSRQQDAGGAKG